MNPVTSYTKLREIRIGRVRRDHCRIILVFAENMAPMDLSGKSVEILFLTGEHVMLSMEPTQIYGAKAIFDMSETQKAELYALYIKIAIRLDGETVADGSFSWEAQYDEKSEAGNAIGINVNTVEESVEWFEVMVGPPGPIGELTEPDRLLVADAVSAAEQVALDKTATENARGEAVSARNEAVPAAATATSMASTAIAQASIATTAAQNAANSAATIQTGGQVVRDDSKLVNGDEVAKKTVLQASLFANRNLYDYRNDVAGDFTLNTATGALFAQANCSVSEVIDVTGVEKVVIANRTGAGGVRFLSATGVPMKPLLSNGSEAANYAGSWIGEFYKPSGAVGFQFVTRFNGTTNKTNITARAESYPNEYVQDSLLKKEGELLLTKNNAAYTVGGAIGNNVVEVTFQTRIGANQNSNPNFALIDMRYNGVIFKYSSDDISPLLTGTGHIGGNHGWGVARTLTLTAHGKTLADVGSVWTDGAGRDFVILRIINANSLILCGRNIGVGGNLTFPAPQGTLNYKASGTNTASMTGYTADALPNLYNTVQLNRSVVLVDGKEVAANGKYPCGSVQIVEDYDVFDLDSTLARLTTLRPPGGYTAQPNLNALGAEKLFNFSLTYTFWSPGKCTITHSIMAYKAVPFGYFGAIQCFAVEGATGRLYIPKALPVGGTQDFRLAPVFSAPAADILYRAADGWEYPDNPPSRLITYTSGGAGVHCGYITDFADGSERKNKLDHAIRVATTKKIYPMAISQALATIPAYTHYTFAAFYNVVDYGQITGIATSRDMVLSNGSLYIFLDYHAAGVDTIQLSTEWSNKQIAVVEKSANVQLLSTAATGDLKVLSQVAGGGYGFIVLKLT